MATEIRNTKTRTRADGAVEALQFKFEEGKRPIPMGWKIITPAPKGSDATPKPKREEGKGASASRKPRSSSARSASSSSSESESLWGWILGAIATGAVVLGGIYIIANRGS